MTGGHKINPKLANEQSAVPLDNPGVEKITLNEDKFKNLALTNRTSV